MPPRPKSQSTKVANRIPPTSEELARVGLARITIRRVDGEDAQAARKRVIAKLPWARDGLHGSWRSNPYQIGTERWVFVYRPPKAATEAA